MSGAAFLWTLFTSIHHSGKLSRKEPPTSGRARDISAIGRCQVFPSRSRDWDVWADGRLLSALTSHHASCRPLIWKGIFMFGMFPTLKTTWVPEAWPVSNLFSKKNSHLGCWARPFEQRLRPVSKVRWGIKECQRIRTTYRPYCPWPNGGYSIVMDIPCIEWYFQQIGFARQTFCIE